MSLSTNSTFQLLISGYSTLFYLPQDVKDLIEKYYTICSMNIHALLIYFKSLSIYNIASNKQYIMDNIANIRSTPKGYYSVINDISLPKSIINENYSNESLMTLSAEQLLSNNWSMLIPKRENLCKSCTLIAFHADLFEPDQCHLFSFKLPGFNNNAIFRFLWNKSKKSLYSMDIFNKQNGKMLSFDFNDTHWKWNVIASDLSFGRTLDAAMCMVDNDRFIAFMGGFMMNIDAELYALNARKSIKLAPMKKSKINADSLYHDEFHKIIIGGRDKQNGIEWYDINKDCWEILIDELEVNELQQMFVSKDNPNILYYTEFERYGLYEIYEIDLRSKNCKSQSVVSLNNVCGNIVYL